MRGEDIFQESLFTTVQLETFMPADHPLRSIKALLNEAMQRLSWLFDGIDAVGGRESIPPVRLIRAQLLQVLYSIRGDRQLVEQINNNLLDRWFVGLDDSVWDHSTFTASRGRLLEHDVITELFEEGVNLARKQLRLSDDHFSVGGTLIQAWASHKSFCPTDDDDHPTGGGRNAEANVHREKRSNETHESKTDSEARLAKKGPGKEARLSYMGTR